MDSLTEKILYITKSLLAIHVAYLRYNHVTFTSNNIIICSQGCLLVDNDGPSVGHVCVRERERERDKGVCIRQRRKQ